jgi:hypothetical protein
LEATRASRLQAKNQDGLATKEHKDHKENQCKLLSMRSLRSFAATVFLAAMREFRAVARHDFYFFAGDTSRYQAILGDTGRY